eukprot:gnl/TRDRNA2_/TRDRNA2_91453_c1_seq2.p1 gnl/TRDRNA2_/TRDRNA2_91453_c1~~gnl/TRDRNA2_/TRDRNA2_91453_c1_seq2.p1  ORF type:complete len:219 (+),score=14.07 gnl/TRDRNA2_/TRDRNA2_91453_c1_seq2:96-752(+)
MHCFPGPRMCTLLLALLGSCSLRVRASQIGQAAHMDDSTTCSEEPCGESLVLLQQKMTVRRSSQQTLATFDAGYGPITTTTDPPITTTDQPPGPLPECQCLKGCVGGYEKIGDSLVEGPMYRTKGGDGSAKKCAKKCDTKISGGKRCKGFTTKVKTKCYLFYKKDLPLVTSSVDPSIIEKYETYVKCKSATTTAAGRRRKWRQGRRRRRKGKGTTPAA